MNRNDLREYFANLKKAHQDEFVGVSTRSRLNEGMMKNIYGQCQNILYEMAQENGYVCHLCVSQAAKQCGMDQFNEIDMHLCCEILQSCIESNLLKAGPCPDYPLVTVYFPVLDEETDLDYGSFEAEEDALDALRNPVYEEFEDEDTEDDLSYEYRRMVNKGLRGLYDK